MQLAASGGSGADSSIAMGKRAQFRNEVKTVGIVLVKSLVVFAKFSLIDK